MISQKSDIVESGPITYQEWIDQVNKQLSSNTMGAQISYEKALELVEDKYEAYMLLGQSFENDTRPALNNFIFALEYANNQIERLLSIATELEKLGYTQISLYIHGLIKVIDPNYDHEIPKNLEDYDNIVKEYIQNGKAKFAKAPIEKLIELSENKLEILLQIGKLIVEDGFYYEQAMQYFERALQLQEDKYDLLLKIGDIYLSNYPDIALKFYDEAKILKPESFEPNLRIVKQKLQIQQFQEALEYIKLIQIPEDKQTNLDFGLLLITKDQSYNDGLEYIYKGIELSQDKLETLKWLINELFGHKLQRVLFEKALEIQTDDEYLWETYVIHLLNFTEKSQETINVIDRALSYHPNYDKFYLHKGNVLIELGRKEEAIAVLQKGIELCPKYGYQQTLGKLLLEAQQFEEGLKQFNQAIEKEEYDALSNLMNSLFENKYYDECIQVCDRYEQQYPDQPFTLQLKAKSFFQAKRYDEALPLLEQVVKGETFYSADAEKMIQQINDIKQGKEQMEQNVEEK